MNTHALRAEVFVHAFRSLPKQEKTLILEEIVAEMEPEFTKEECSYLKKLSRKKCLEFRTAKDAIRYVKEL